jgi:hypothetical protein
MPEAKSAIFPQYELFVNGKRSFVPLNEAARAMDSLMCHVSVGDIVLESDGVLRNITRDEVDRLNQLTDEWSALR